MARVGSLQVIIRPSKFATFSQLLRPSPPSRTKRSLATIDANVTSQETWRRAMMAMAFTMLSFWPTWAAISYMSLMSLLLSAWPPFPTGVSSSYPVPILGTLFVGSSFPVSRRQILRGHFTTPEIYLRPNSSRPASRDSCSGRPCQKEQCSHLPYDRLADHITSPPSQVSRAAPSLQVSNRSLPGQISSEHFKINGGSYARGSLAFAKSTSHAVARFS